MPDTLTIAVVGHANSGKTSLMRTLLRDTKFGDVSETPGTTRHVEGGALLVEGNPVAELFDTPGLEDSIRLLELLELEDPDGKTGGIERLQSFLKEQGNFPEFGQEAKVVRQLLRSDLSFYVIDVREPVLGKYIDELKIIAFAARPVIPVLNFIATDRTRLAEWREQLARLGLHATVEFDTVAFNVEDEKRLYQKIQSLLASHYEEIQSLINSRQQQWALTRQATAAGIADLFVNVASFRLAIESGQSSLQTGVERTRVLVREAESSTSTNALRLFGFTREDVDSGELPVDSGQWKMDLFDSALLKEFGLKAGSDAAKGGAIGAGIDVITGGLSLGLAAALGVVAGLLWSTARRYGSDLATSLRGHRHLCVSENTLKVLWIRQVGLLQTLLGRGHASSRQIRPGSDIPLPEQWAEWLVQLRNHNNWSALGVNEAANDPERDKITRAITDSVLTDYRE